MKKLLIIALMLAGSSAFADLTPATDGRLTDYQNWFGAPFNLNVSSDAYYPGEPSPVSNTPAPGTSTANATWSGWQPNWSPGLSPTSGINGGATGVTVEMVLVGETAGWWDGVGYRLNGVDTQLTTGIQTAGVFANYQVNEYTYFTLGAGQTLDFYVNGTGTYGPNAGTTPGVNGGRYYVYNKALNTPAGATMQSYDGQLTTLASVRDPKYAIGAEGPYVWNVVAFEDINPTGSGLDGDFNDVIIAYRFAADLPQGVPEPSTFGLIGAAGLLGLVAYRRSRKA
jgi:hypothetical protein